MCDCVKLKGTFTNSLSEENKNYSWTRNGKKSLTEQHIWCDSLRRDNKAVCKCQTRSKNVCWLLAFHTDTTSVYLQNIFHNPGITAQRDCKERKGKTTHQAEVEIFWQRSQNISTRKKNNLTLFGKKNPTEFTRAIFVLPLFIVREEWEMCKNMLLEMY